MKQLIFSFTFLLIGILNYGQTIGDFRTPAMFADNQPTAWSDPNSWERWDGSAWVVPTFPPADTNNVEIIENAYYVLDADAMVNNLLVSGKLAFWGDQGNKTLDIVGSLIVTGEFRCLSNTVWYGADNVVSVWGDINNSGIINFHDDNGLYECLADLVLYGAGENYFYVNTGSTTNLVSLVIQKSSVDDIVNFVYNGGNLGAYGLTTTGFLYLYDGTSSVGTFNLTGSGTYSYPLFNPYGSEYGISENCKFVVDNPNFTIYGSNLLTDVNASFKNKGQLMVRRVKEFYIGNNNSNHLVLFDNSLFRVESGAVGVFGSIYDSTSANPVFYEQVGGGVWAGLLGTSHPSRSIFELGSNVDFTLNDASIYLIRNRISGTFSDYKVYPNWYDFSNGMIQFGTLNTNEEERVWLTEGYMPGLSTYNSGSIINHVALNNDVIVEGNVRIKEGTDLYLDDYNYFTPHFLAVYGDSIINSGSIYGEAVGSKLYLLGYNNQIFDIMGSFPNGGIDTLYVGGFNDFDGVNNLNITGNLHVKSALLLDNSYIDSDSDTLFLGQNTEMYLANGYVKSYLGRYFGVGSHTYTYQVGGDRLLSPMILQINNVTSAGYVTSKVNEGVHPNAPDTNSILKRYWNVGKTSSLVFDNYNIQMDYDSSDFNFNFKESLDEDIAVIGKYSSGVWTYPAITGRNTVGEGGNITTSGTINFSDFTLMKATPPNANFTFDTACNGAITTFTDLSDYGNGQSLTSWFWDFGDGATSDLQNPTHQYLTPDNYDVTLIVSNNNGLYDTVTQTVPVVEVYAQAPSDTLACYNEEISLTATGGTNYLWSNGGTTQTILVSPTIETKYYVTANTLGCTTMDSLVVSVSDLYMIGLMQDDSVICYGDSILLSINDLENKTSLFMSLEDTFIVKIPLNLTFTNFTVEFWTYPTRLNGQTKGASAWGSFRIGTGANGEFYCGTNTSTAFNSETIDSLFVPIGTLEVDKWQHFAFVYDSVSPDSGIAHIYKNGILLGTKMMYKPIEIDTFRIFNSNKGFNDELRIWNTVRNEAEIKANMYSSLSGSEYGLLAYYNFEDSTVNDITSNNINGIVDNTLGTAKWSNIVPSSSNFIWSTGNKSSTIRVRPLEETTYSITITKDGCEKIESIVVNTKPAAYADAGLDQRVCSNSSTVLSATGAGNMGGYSWNTGHSDSIITIYPTFKANYIVTVTNIYNCTNADTVFVLVDVPTNKIITQDTNLCQIDTIVLKASGNSNSLEFNIGGANDYVVINNNPNLQITGDQTIEMWVRPTEFGATRFLFEKARGGEGRIALLANGTVLYNYGTSGIGVAPYQNFNSRTALKLNEWNHIAVTRDTVNMLLYWYINGDYDSWIYASYPSATKSSSNITFGNYYKGYIDEVRVWNRVLTIDEIRQKYTKALDYKEENGLVGYWRMEEGSGTTVYDYSGNNFNGTLQNNVAYSIDYAYYSNYNWSTGSTSQNIKVYTTENTLYTVTITTGVCEARVDSVNVIISDFLVANAGDDQTICRGASTFLSAETGDEGITYTWSTGSNDTTIEVSPTSTTNYILTVGNYNCVLLDSVTVYIDKPVEDFIIYPDTFVCKGDSILISTDGNSNSVKFNAGATDNVRISNNSKLQITGNNTIEMWIKPLAISGTRFIYEKARGGEGRISLTTTGHVLYNYGTSGTSNSPYQNFYSSTPLLINEWTHIAIVRDTVNMKLYWYINGNLDNQATASYSTATKSSFDVTLGSYFSGYIDEVRVWNKVLSGENINENMNKQIIPNEQSGLVAYWRMNEYTGSIVNDHSGNNLNGTMFNNVTRQTDIPFTYEYLWNNGSSNHYIKVAPTELSSYVVTISKGACSVIDTINVGVIEVVANAGVDKTICLGDEVMVIGAGGVSYNWSTGATNDTIYVSPVETTTYSLTVTTNGCSDTDAMVVTVNGLPTANAGVDKTICEGDEVMIIGAGGVSYNWSNGAINDTINVSPTETTTYSLTVTTNGCTDTDAMIVTVNGLPTANAGVDKTICEGDEVMIIGAGGVSYNWSNGATNDTILVSPTETTTYSLTVTTNGCTDIDAMVVTVNGLPTANAGVDKTICEGDEVMIIGAGGVSYNWSNGATNDTILVSPTETTTYSLTVTTGGCTDIDAMVVTVNGLPTANAGVDKTICEGDEVMIIGEGGVSYNWSTGATNDTINVSPTETTTYSLTVTTNGCTDTDAMIVTVNGLPTANAGVDKTICEGDEVMIIGEGGVSYNWSTGATNDTINVSPTETTTYSLTVTTGGCTDIDAMVVTVNGLPTANSGVDKTICEGDEVMIIGAGGVSYNWSNGAINDTINVSPTETTTYSLTVTTGGCTDIDAMVVTVNGLPTANAGVDKTICEGDEVMIIGEGGVSYNWSTGATNDTINVSPTETTTYSLTVTTNGCTDTDAMIVTVNGLPTANAGVDKTICEGDEVMIIGEGGVSYNWSTGAINDTINVSPTETTTYSLTVTTGGCTDIDAMVVTVNGLPTANAGVDKTICEGDEVMIIGAGGVSYNWSNGAINNTINVSPTETTTYSLTVTTNGCTDTDAMVVTVNGLPTANAGVDKTICEGDEVMIIGEGGVSYNWSTGATNDTINVSPTETTTYSLTVTTGGCTDIDAMVVTVNGLPTANAGVDKTICEGDEVMIIGAGGVSYNWSTGATNDTINVSPTETTTYSLTVTTGGCTDIDAMVVTVNGLPTANAGVDKTICEGDEVMIIGAGGVSYNWSTGATNDTINVSPTETTTYSLTVTTGGCTDIDAMVVTVNGLPTANAGVDKTICEGDEVMIIGAGGVSYNWSTGATNDTIYVSPVETTTYSLTVTTGGCTDIDAMVVTVNGLPTANAGVDKTICEGDEVMIIGAGGVSYNWSTGATNDTIYVSPTETTTYSLTVTTGGCTDIDAMVVTVNGLPTANAGVDKTICEGDEVMIIGAGGVSYNWSTGATNDTINVSPTETTTYSLTVTTGGCTDIDAMVVTVNGLPTANAGVDKTICEGDEVMIIGAGGVSYNWSTGATNDTIYVSPVETTTYSLTVTTNGCTDIDAMVVTVNGLPTANAGVDKTICEGDEVMIIGEGGVSYNWSTGATNDTINVSPTETTTYSLTVTTGGCTDIDAMVVTVNGLPTANAGVDKTICEGDEVMIIGAGGVSYNWSTGATNDTINVSPTETTTYSLTVTTGGCTDTDAMVVTVNGLPTANAGVDKTICEGDEVMIIGAGGVSYNWSTGATNDTINVSPTETTTYSLTVTTNGCTDTDAMVVTVNGLPTANAGVDKTICLGDEVMVIGEGGVSYNWSTGATNDTIYVSPIETTTYSLTVTTGGCTDIDEMVVTVNESVSIEVGDDLCILNGNSTTLTASGADTYLWNTTEITESISVNPIEATTYKVTGFVGSCSASEQIIVKVSDMALSSINTTGRVSCNGSADGFGRIIMVGDNEDYTYKWSTGVTVDTIFGLSGGNYLFTVKDINGCEIIDTFKLFEPNYFAEVSNLGHINKTEKSIVLTWNKNVETTSYFARLKRVGDNNIRYININPADTFVLINLLEPNTEYVFNIRQFKDENTYSCTPSYNFTTLEKIENPCNITTGLNVNNIATTTSQLNWNNDVSAISYMIRWRVKAGPGAWKYYNAISGQVSVLIGDLTSNTTYEWQMRKFCEDGFSSDFTDLIGSEFTTSAGNCEEANPMAVSNITYNSVNLNWTNIANENGYMVRWRVKAGPGAWTYYNATAGENNCNASNLIANTQYEWQIRSFCVNGTISSFTALNTFSTLVNNCQNVSNLSQEVNTTYAILKWDTVAGADHYLLRWREADGVWKFINISGQISRQQIGCVNCDEIHKLKPNTNYEWAIRAFCNEGGTLYSNFSAIQQFSTIEAKEMENIVNEKYVLKNIECSVFPNPFNERFSIEYIIPVAGDVKIELFDIKGQLINSVTNEYKTEGKHIQTYELRNNSNGNIFFIRFIYNNEIVVRKIVKIQ